MRRGNDGGVVVVDRRPSLVNRLGFTLVEILVAIAIFTALMAGVVLTFNGAVRAVKTGYQRMDAFEQARGAMRLLRDELTTSFSAREYADYYNFFGTPVGMTFIGVAKGRSGIAADLNISRVTYVVYNLCEPAGVEFPEKLEQAVVDPTTGRPVYGPTGQVLVESFHTAYPYPLLHYTEPGIGDLDALPLDWEGIQLEILGNETVKARVDRYVENAWALYNSSVYPEWPGFALNPEWKDDFVRMLRRQLWMRMLAGGDDELIAGGLGSGDRPLHFFYEYDPASTTELDQASILYWLQAEQIRRENPAWSAMQVSQEAKSRAYYKNFVIADSVCSTKSPRDRRNTVANIINWHAGVNFFDYDFPYPSTGELQTGPGAVYKTDNAWWNHPLSLNCNPQWDWRPHNDLPLAKFCMTPCLPEVVSLTFWMIQDSPYVGAPDFEHRFCEQIFIPTAYARSNDG